MANAEISADHQSQQSEPIVVLGSDIYPTRIYVLKDPRTGQVRYVGKTINALKSRLMEHIREAFDITGNSFASKKCKWIRALYENGNLPSMEQIDYCTTGWQEKERHWIAFYRQEYPDLTNVLDGGEGAPYGNMLARARIAKYAAQEDAYKEDEITAFKRLLKYSNDKQNLSNAFDFVNAITSEIEEVQRNFVIKKILAYLFLAGDNGLTERQIRRQISENDWNKNDMDSIFEFLLEKDLVKLVFMKTGGRNRRAIVRNF